MAPQEEEAKDHGREHLFAKRNSRDFVKEDARKAVHEVINKAYQSALLEASARDYDSLSISNKMDYTFQSHEEAMDRGTKLGSIEMNESERIGKHFEFQGSPRRQLFLDEAEQTPDRTRTTVFSGSTTRSFKWLRRNRNKVKKEVEQPEEAWMCGVCSKTFSSYDAAEKHEDYHIKEVLTDLGWAGDDINVLPNFFGTNGMSSLNEINDKNNPERAKPPPKEEDQLRGPDVLRLSQSPLRPFKRTSVQPFTPALKRTTVVERRNSNESFDEGSNDEDYNLATGVGVPQILTPIIETSQENQILSSFRGDGVVPLLLADEALVDVCHKAESLGLLTRAEQDAEFEIECLAKDKAYYDLLFERQTQRKRDRTYRFRREGTSAISIVQNKFVDAYQLMKEGKTKSGNNTLDYYTRKLKGNAPEELVLDHTRNTLYVNVMVKESIKVVRHELERLAKKRWEDSLQNNGEETDIQRKRFQKFRAAAQGNLVKLAGYALASDFTPRRVSIDSAVPLFLSFLFVQTDGGCCFLTQIAVQLSNDLYRYVELFILVGAASQSFLIRFLVSWLHQASYTETETSRCRH